MAANVLSVPRTHSRHSRATIIADALKNAWQHRNSLAAAPKICDCESLPLSSIPRSIIARKPPSALAGAAGEFSIYSASWMQISAGRAAVILSAARCTCSAKPRFTQLISGTADQSARRSIASQKRRAMRRRSNCASLHPEGRWVTTNHLSGVRWTPQ